MTALLLARRAGQATTIQDLGRTGHQRFGVPVGGALDTTSLRLANAVVGNALDAAGLEFRLVGPELVVEADSVRVAFGGGVEATIGNDPPRIVSPWRGVTLARGQVLRMRVVAGAMGYLAVAGGLAIEPVLGSRSTYVRAGFGGLEGRALEDGDRLPLVAARAEGDDQVLSPPGPESGPLHVIMGPQDEAFTDQAIETFLGVAFTVGREADRMGVRLDGPCLAHRTDANIVSDGIASGAIQVPANGQPIVLLADRQTVGGYTKVATVISADLPRAGQLKPGDDVRFEAVTVERAIELRRGAEADLARRIAGIGPAPPIELDEDALFGGNLISGVVDAADLG